MDAPWRWWRRCRRRGGAAGHGLQEDVFQRITAVVHAAYLHRMFRGQTVELAHLNVVWQHHLKRPRAKAGALATQRAHRLQKTVALGNLELQKLQVGFSLLFKVAHSGNSSLFQDNYLITALFYVAQQVRRDEKVDFAGVADFL